MSCTQNLTKEEMSTTRGAVKHLKEEFGVEVN